MEFMAKIEMQQTMYEMRREAVSLTSFRYVFWCSAVIKACTSIRFYFQVWEVDRFRRLVFVTVVCLGFSYCLLDLNLLIFFLIFDDFFFGYNVYDLLDVLRGCSLTRPFSSQIMILAFVGKLLNIYFKQ